MSVETALATVAQKLGVKSDDLAKLINFESAFNPAATNPISGARGLIQFMPDTAKSLGFKNADEIVQKYPGVESQLLGPVLTYLSSYKPYTTPQSLYMAVFYPRYRFVAPDTAFSDLIRAQNPGINFVSDYISKVEKKTSKIISLSKGSFIGYLFPIGAATLAAVYITHKKEIEPWLKRMMLQRKK